MVDGPDDYWRINRLLFLLGRIRDAQALPTIAQLVDKTTAGGPPVRDLNPYIRGRIDMQRVPHYDRLLCLAACVERLAAPELAAPMERLLARPHIGGYCTTEDEDSAGPNYHSALAEVRLTAAAARCGSRRAAERLVVFLEDCHEILARFAHSELRAIARTDPGRSVSDWRRRLENRSPLPPAPCPDTPPVF